MPETAGDDDGGGDPEIIAMLKQEFPAPLNNLLLAMYDHNPQYWLCPARSNTVGAASVRQQGLLPTQMEWALAGREQMRGPHPLWTGDLAVDVDAEEIVSDTSVDDYLGGELR